MNGAADARVTHHSAVPTYSAKPGRVPSSERLHTTLHIGYNTTVVPAPKNAVTRTSQQAALFAIGDLSPLRVDGRTFYPSVLFGLVTNSVMGMVCGTAGATPTPPSSTPTTACRQGLFYQRTPAWVVIQHGACTQPNGEVPHPQNAITTTTTTLDPARCVLYTFVSATTGKYLYGEN
jgi:hypothetical protein